MPAAVAAVLAGGLVAPQSAVAAPTTTGPEAPSSARGDVPDVDSGTASAAGAARAAAADEALAYVPDTAPAAEDPVTQARLTAAQTGQPVPVADTTSGTRIVYAQPDGTLTEETSAAPVRVEQDGDWVPVDTDLAPDEASGVLVPAAVVGERSISAGGTGPMATLGQHGVSLSFSWPTALPTPEVEGGTATYRDVLAGVNLVVTATTLGFTQQLVIDAPLADPSSLTSIALPVTATGVDLATAADGSLTATDAAGGLVATAGAPLMWDADGGPDANSAEGTGTEPVPAGLTATTGGKESLVLTPDVSFLSDPATSYPVTIDPSPALTAMGDTFVTSDAPTTAQAGAAQLKTGTPDGEEQTATFLQFDTEPIDGYWIDTATLQLWNSYSGSCGNATSEVYDTDNIDPVTLTWNDQPGLGDLLASSSTSLGHDASCPAGSIDYDLTSDLRNASGAAWPNVSLAVVASDWDTAAFKTFNSGSSGVHVPTLTVTYTDDCTAYGNHLVCGAIRDLYQQWGGPDGDLGLPISNTYPGPDGGKYQDFTDDATILWSPASGAQVVRYSIRDRYFADGGPTAFGWPINEEQVITEGVVSVQEFRRTGATDPGAIYWSAEFDARYLDEHTYAYYKTVGATAGFLGYPSSDTYRVGSATWTEFAGGLIIWDEKTNTAQALGGQLALAGTPGWATQLSYQLTDTTKAQVNVGSGNLNLSIAGLSVPGIGGDRGVGVVYNSYAAFSPDGDGSSSLLGLGYRLTESPDVKLFAYPDNSVRYLDPSGRALVYRWNGTAYETPVGDGGTTLTRDGSNNWVLTTLSSQRKQTFRVADGLLLTDTDRNGVAYTFTYTAAGVPTAITGTRGGAAISFTIGGTGVPAGHLRSMSQTIDGVTRTVTYGYNGAGKLTSVTDASGKVTSYGWTGSDVTSITDPRGKVIAVSYDDFHRVTQVVRDYGTNKINATTGYSYDVENRDGIDTSITRVTDPNGNVTAYTVDGFGKVLDATDALGHKKATTYSPNNDVASAVDAMPAANTTTYSYNGADGGYSPTGATAPTGASSSASYPSSGNGPQRYLPSSATDSQGNATTLSYDAAGNPTQQISGGVTTSTTYNPPAGQATICAGGGKAGQACTQTDGRGGVTTFTYDVSGNLLTVTPPAGAIKPTHNTFDGAGRPKTVTDGNGKVTAYVYDKNDRVTQVRYDSATSCTTASRCEAYSYDDSGNLVSRVDGAGTTSYGYDALNRLHTQTTAAASGGGAQTSTSTYDLGGNLTAFTTNIGITRYGYDAGNNLISLAEPGGSCTGTVSKCTQYTYNANDARTKITYPGNTTVQYLNIDASGRPLQYKATNTAGTVFMNFTYNYTGGNGDTSLVQSRSDTTVAGTAVQTYSYDPLDRLTRALEKVGATTTASWSYCYDANGNRTYDSTSTAATVLCPTDSGGPAATYTYDATNALTARTGQPAFAYDGNGAELAGAGTTTRTAATWSLRGQLTGVTSNGAAQTYAYTGESNKERLSANGNGYQNTALGVTSRTGTGGYDVIREPNGTPVALRVGSNSYYYVADRQGSTIALVDSTGIKKNGYSYDPYGASRSKTETVNNPWQYTGGELDSTGLYHLQYRYYDPALGRFTQPDPSGQDAHYLYAGNNPTNSTDPTGLARSRSISGNAGTFRLRIRAVGNGKFVVTATINSDFTVLAGYFRLTITSSNGRGASTQVPFIALSEDVTKSYSFTATGKVTVTAVGFAQGLFGRTSGSLPLTVDYP